ncbi:MAG TPA: ArsA-related P-loop ATPase [Acidimicrobiia bacterium]
MNAPALDDIVEHRHIAVCCGTGGVGKTTTAAVLAIEAARRGRNAVVVTIDPAKRLADTLGLDRLTDTPSTIDRSIWAGADRRGSGNDAGAAHPNGQLSALMLDTKSTFDGLVTRYAVNEEQAQRILDNGFYRNVSGALGGTQEYMAMEKLHELHAEGGYDLIVVDTPPSRHALDFLDAPARLLRLLDNRMFRLLMMPARTYMRVAGMALQTFLRTVSRVVGREVIDDIIAFFQAFEGMEAGFRERAGNVQALIDDPETAFVLVTSPRRDALDEATFFANRLHENGLDVAALVVNRVHPELGHDDPAALRDLAARVDDPALAAGLENLADFRTIAIAERTAVAELQSRIESVVAFVPLLDHDVHDVDALSAVGRYLVTGASAGAIPR